MPHYYKMCLTEVTIPENNSSSFDSSAYTPKKKKQKIHASRPPLAPTKKSNTIKFPPSQVMEESRCEQQVCTTTTTTSVCTQTREINNGMAELRVLDTTTKDTVASWNNPYVLHKNKKSFHPVSPRLEEDDERMSSFLDGLELLEMMSFDEYDDDYQQQQQQGEDQSLCYSVISEGS